MVARNKFRFTGELLSVDVTYPVGYAAFCIRGIPLKDFYLCPKFVIGNIYENPELIGDERV